ncbi:MAG: hypothetical protein PHW69_08590 [Elusimicrobiaceae bacterium]|nr:hypothetical protein [Elusimicrobiaceae bacterium]
MAANLRTFLLIPLLTLCAQPARALWLEDEFTFGDGGYIGNRAALYGVTEPNSILGAEFATTKRAEFSDVIYAVRIPWYITAANGLNIMKMFYYLPTGAVDSVTAGVVDRRVLNIYGRSGDDFSAALAVGFGAALQNMPYNSDRITVPEMCYTLDYVHDYYGEFNFMLSGAIYQYGTSVGGTRRFPGASFDQTDLADLGLLTGTLAFPKASGGFQFTRVDKDNNNAALYLSYHYISFMPDMPVAHSLGTGIRMHITDTSFFNFDYNWVAQGSYSIRNSYRFLVKAGF